MNRALLALRVPNLFSYTFSSVTGGDLSKWRCDGGVVEVDIADSGLMGPDLAVNVFLSNLWELYRELTRDLIEVSACRMHL